MLICHQPHDCPPATEAVMIVRYCMSWPDPDYLQNMSSDSFDQPGQLFLSALLLRFSMRLRLLQSQEIQKG